jgi:hypothetical protein
MPLARQQPVFPQVKRVTTTANLGARPELLIIDHQRAAAVIRRAVSTTSLVTTEVD